MALAYPGPTSELSDVIAKDAFLDALDDSKLRREVLIQQPLNLDSALNMASRLEAHDRKPSECNGDAGSGDKRRKNKFVRSANATGSTSTSAANQDDNFSKRVDSLQRKLDEILNKLSTVERPAAERSSPAVCTDSTRLKAVCT